MDRSTYFVIILGLIPFLIIGGATSLVWWTAGKQAQVYEQTTGKHVTQSEKFWGSEMFKILPKDIVQK